MTQHTVRELIADLTCGAKSIVDGLRVTFYNLAFRKRVTDQYPHRDPQENYKPGPGYRGMLGLITNPETGELNCMACGQCQKICPSQCIIVRGEGKGKERKPVEFTIDMSLCMYCGLCTEVCPFDAITMTPRYTGSVEHLEELVWDINRLREEGKGMAHISRVKAARTAEATTDNGSSNG
ncbi:MAG: NuoI/complex I 23 kDa subunit family protein [Candidatus Zipacnadales bacterium]